MRISRETHTESIMKLLEKLNLAPEHLDLLESYLSGEKGEEVLKDLPYKNLTASHQSDTTVFAGLFKHGKMEEAGKLFHILFAIGGTSCTSLLPRGIGGGNGLMYLWKLPVDTDKALAVYAADAGIYQYRIATGIQQIIKLTDRDAEAVRRAYLLADYPKNVKNIPNIDMHSCGSAKLILLAAYFLIKYPDAGKLLQKEEKQRGILTGINKFFGKTPEVGRQVKDEDIPLMQQYEDILVNNLINIYDAHTMPASIMQDIKQAVRQNQITDNILKLSNRKCKISTYTLNLLGGTALLNFTLSDILRNVVKICFAASVQDMFTIAVTVSNGLWMDIRYRGGDYDDFFDIDQRALILQAASRNLDTVLKEQFRKNKAIFIQILDRANAHDSSVMMKILEQEDKPLFLERRKDGTKERDKLIDLITERCPKISEAKKYLRGEMELSDFLFYEDQIFTKYGYGGNVSQLNQLLQAYAETYLDHDFYNRAMVYYFLSGTTYFFYWGMIVNGTLNTQNVRKIFSSFEKEYLDAAHQLKFYSMMYQYFYNEKHKELLKNTTVEIFCKYITVNREEILSAFKEADAASRVLALAVLSKDPEKNKTEILSYAQDGSKLVKEMICDILCQQKDWETEILTFLSSKKAAERELAVRTLAKWDSEKYQPELTALLEKEKNGKVRALLQDLFNAGVSQAGSVLTLQDLVKQIHKGGKKRTLAWAYETPFSEVHKKAAGIPVSDGSIPDDGVSDGNTSDNGVSDSNAGGNQNISEPILADEEYLQAILLSYASMPTCGVNKDAAALAAELNEAEFAVYVNELFDKWLALGAEAKKRWVLYAASIHGGTDIIKKLQHQINDWPQHSRGAIAADAVQALALNPKPEALLIVDSISRKFKFRQVKAAAAEALKFAAEQLGITTEELADRIVPNLGFDEKMERHFDYGERSFTVTITPALEIEVFDESGKKLKNLPAPGKKDDPEKSAESYAAFKEMKKQMKTTVSSQKMRLEMALSTERKWTCEAWKKLFVENPIMHQFAIGLIWGIYEDNRLMQTFRYMEDGSFNTEEEEEFILPEDNCGLTDNVTDSGQNTKPNAENNAENSIENSAGQQHASPRNSAFRKQQKIGLVHPVELSEESISAWKTQLEDYEITQPIEQLSRPVYHMMKEEADSKSMERFGGYILNDLSLIGKMQNMGWYRGQAEDAGIFYYFYREDKEQGLRAELNFSGTYVAGENEDVTVLDVKFNKKISELSERYFSEIVMQTARAVSSSQERNEFWKE